MDINHFLISLGAMLNEMSPYLLLGFLAAGFLHVFVRPETMTRHLSGPGWKPVVKAALFGIPVPLCSCGVLPAAVSLRRRGASKGASTSFLIATPQTGVDSIAATYSLMGLPFALLRPLAALAGAAVGGMAVERWGGTEKISDDISPDSEEEIPDGFFAKLAASVRYGLVDMVASVGRWLVAGLLVAALITVFVPESFFVSLSSHPLLAMLAVLVVAVPMYICATGSIPVAVSLMMKGLSPGIAFVMLMAGPAANFASVMILSKTNGVKSTAIYITTVALTAVLVGLSIDLLFPASWFVPSSGMSQGHCHAEFSLFETSCSILLVGLLIYSFLTHRHHHHHHLKSINTDMTHEYKVDGLACTHCQARVEKAILALPGVEEVEVSLKDGIATVKGDVQTDAVVDAVTKAGYECRLG